MFGLRVSPLRSAFLGNSVVRSALVFGTFLLGLVCEHIVGVSAGSPPSGFLIQNRSFSVAVKGQGRMGLCPAPMRIGHVVCDES